MGYASKDERVVGELEGTIGTPYCFENVEVGCSVFNVVSLGENGTQEILKIGSL
jgi:hypothetical protein